jgi:hypothetical protein
LFIPVIRQFILKNRSELLSTWLPHYPIFVNA